MYVLKKKKFNVLLGVEATQKDCFTPADRDPDHVQRI